MSRVLRVLSKCIQMIELNYKYNGFNRGFYKKTTEWKNVLRLQVFAGLAFLWPASSKKAVAQNVETAESILTQADDMFDDGHYEECHKLLKSHENPNDVEIQWRLCRVLYNMSKEEKFDKNKKKELIMEAYEIISDQLVKNPTNFAVQKWYALLLDARSGHVSINERIKQLENVKKHMDVAANLNPKDATILHMLGEWCYQIAEMPWHQRKIAEVLFSSPPRSSHEEALEYFLKAETAQPRFYSLNLLRLGACYLKLQKEDQAKYYLKLAASYPAKSNDDHLANTEAADLLKKIK